MKVFKKIRESLLFQVIIFFSLMLVVLGTYFMMFQVVEYKKINNRGTVFDACAVADVTELSNLDDGIQVTGWVLQSKGVITDVKLVLTPVDGQKTCIIDTEFADADAVLNEYRKYLKIDNKSLGQGFVAEVENRILNGCCYEVKTYFEYQTDETVNTISSETIKTGKYLYNGQIYDYVPEEFYVPIFNDEQMRTVVEQGKLCGYSLYDGAWVYWYEDCIYWILDRNIEQNLDEDLYMFLHFYTLNNEWLPEWQQKYGIDNLDFRFNTREIVLDEDTDYRVAKFVVAVNYPVTWFNTGHYFEEKNLWVVNSTAKMY